FLVYAPVAQLDLPSFPTRRSSDLLSYPCRSFWRPSIDNGRGYGGSDHGNPGDRGRSICPDCRGFIVCRTTPTPNTGRFWTCNQTGSTSVIGSNIPDLEPK